MTKEGRKAPRRISVFAPSVVAEVATCCIAELYSAARPKLLQPEFRRCFCRLKIGDTAEYKVQLCATAPKLQRRSKHQIPKSRHEAFWCLMFAASLVLGSWSFVCFELRASDFGFDPVSSVNGDCSDPGRRLQLIACLAGVGAAQSSSFCVCS